MTDQYHHKRIRALLLGSFSIAELKVLIHDQPDLREFDHEIGEGDSKAKIVDNLIEYASRRLLISTLLATVQELRPGPYEEHGPYDLAGGGAAHRRLEALLYEAAGQVLDRPDRLFGRDAQRRKVHGLLDERRQALLYGPGGAGKTALAATVAYERIEDGQGPVIWLETRQAGADAVFDALARRFATEEEKAKISGWTVRAKIGEVRKLLARMKPGLLVLDSVWKGTALPHVRMAVPETLPVLVTSRQLLLDEWIELDELTPEAGLGLLGYHAGNRDYRLDADARALCEQLGWHAYAIEIAGTILLVDQLTPARLAQRIADAPHDVPMPKGFAEQGRESVKELLDDSVEALEGEARQVFLAFGCLFVPRATTALLSSCPGQQPRAVKKHLPELMRRSLVKRQPDGDFYHLHDLTGSYARAMWEDQGQDRRGTVAAVARYAEAHAQDLDLLAFDQDNLLEAASAARVEDLEALKTIISVLARGGYMDARGHTRGFLELLDVAIEAVREEGAEGQETLHYLLSKRGNAHFDRGELQEAYEVYQEALELAPEGNRAPILLAVLGKVLSEQGKYQESDNLFKEGIKLAEAKGDLGALTFVLQQQGFALGRRGDFEAARECAETAVGLCGRLEPPNPTGLGYLLLNLGSTEYEAGLIHEALASHRQARKIAQDAGNLDLEAAALYGLGRDLYALDRPRDAREHLAEARRLFRESGNTAEEMELMVYMAEPSIPVSVRSRT